MGYIYLARSALSVSGGHKTLKEQLQIITFDALKRVKVFSLLIRLFLITLLALLLCIDILTGVYTTQQSFPLVILVFVYALFIVFLLRKTLNIKTLDLLENHYDWMYVTLEIFSIYLAILAFPTHAANIYSNSLKGFWFTLIVLSVFTGKWYYGFYSGFLVGALNSTFFFQYEGIQKEFMIHGLYLEKIDPSIQIFVLSIYYILTGAFVAFPFYLFRKYQHIAINIKTENIIAQPYFDLAMKDGDVQFDEYLITKITSSTDIIGADYVAIKKIKTPKDGKYVLIIGDTIGHGINRSPGAIIAMAAFKAIDSSDPVQVLEAINRALIHTDKFSGGNTLCMCILIKSDGIIEMAGKAESVKLISPKKHGVKHLASKDIATKGEILGVSDTLRNTKKSTLTLDLDHLLMISTDGAHYQDDLDDKTIVMITRRKRLPKNQESTFQY